jgi:competence protein ComEA
MRGWATAVGIGLIGLMIVAGAALLLASRPEPVTITIIPPPPTATPFVTPTPEALRIYVTGAVRLPGALLTMPHGARVEDAVQASGGFMPDADISRINLARLLADGEQIHVPRIGETVTTASGDAVIRINTATAAELMALPGIGEVLAGRIIAYREANGAFRSMADLDAVEGIGSSLITELAGRIAFD